jgi:four helix bundle protein
MRQDLQKRLIRFAGMCINVKKSLRSCYESDHLAKQLIRSSTSAALNYGEAQGAESKKDFIHKQSVLLKELRESYVNLLILKDNDLSTNSSLINLSEDECNQLISIFVRSIQTAKRNLDSK